jgi:hypothetical protein
MTKRISFQHNSNDWTADLADVNSPSWTKGIQIIKDRFESRYFNPISQLLNSSDTKVKYSCGFLIMSIDCLLIETLNQFYLGLSTSDEKYYRDNPDPLYRANQQAFRDFFKHSSFFPAFKTDERVCNTFYKEIRCGLLHQAQSKTNSLINVKEPEMVKFLDPSNPDNGLVINRILFHQAFVDEFNKYLHDLEDPTSANILGENLREKCNRKMKDLCS